MCAHALRVGGVAIGACRQQDLDVLPPPAARRQPQGRGARPVSMVHAPCPRCRARRPREEARHVGVSAESGHRQRPGPVRVERGGIGARRKERCESVDQRDQNPSAPPRRSKWLTVLITRHAACPECGEQGGWLGRALHVGRCPVGFGTFNELRCAGGGGGGERRDAFGVPRARVRARCEERPHELRVPTRHRDEQCRVSALVRRASVRARLEEAIRYRRVPPRAGCEQRRVAAQIGRVNLGTGAQQRSTRGAGLSTASPRARPHVSPPSNVQTDGLRTRLAWDRP